MLSVILLSATIGLPPATIYLYKRFVLHKPYVYQKNDLLVPLLAAIIQFLASTVPYYFLGYVSANFLHHAIGGGVAVAVMTQYVVYRLWPQLAFWQKGFAVLAAANILGNANEILELAADLLTDTYVISSRLDTNIDLVANNLGALVGFILILAAQRFIKRYK